MPTPKTLVMYRTHNGQRYLLDPDTRKDQQLNTNVRNAIEAALDSSPYVPLRIVTNDNKVVNSATKESVNLKIAQAVETGRLTVAFNKDLVSELRSNEPRPKPQIMPRQVSPQGHMTPKDALNLLYKETFDQTNAFFKQTRGMGALLHQLRAPEHVLTAWLLSGIGAAAREEVAPLLSSQVAGVLQAVVDFRNEIHIPGSPDVVMLRRIRCLSGALHRTRHNDSIPPISILQERIFGVEEEGFTPPVEWEPAIANMRREFVAMLRRLALTAV